MWSALSLECVLHKPEQSSKCGLRLQSVEGGAVTILAITPGGLAASAGLLAGDELRKVAGQAVASGDDVSLLLSQAVGAVSVRVMRGNLPPAAASAAPAAAPPLCDAAPPLPLPADFVLAAVEVHEFVYHEKQVSALCGVHALNNLLQGPYYGAGDLADVARALDARELALLTEEAAAPAAAADAPDAAAAATAAAAAVEAAESATGKRGPCDKCDGDHDADECPHFRSAAATGGGATGEPTAPATAPPAALPTPPTGDSDLDAALAASLAAGDQLQAATGVPAVPPTPVSQHVNEATGDFSIEVLGQALSQHGAWLLNTEHETVVVQVMEAPEAEQAFLCHRRGHWFALRALCGMWWSLDSTLKHPQLIPPPLLATFLAVQRAEGHTVHVLRGTPLPLPQLSRQSLSAGRDDVWHPIDRLIESQASAGGGAANTALSETYERLVLGEGGRTTHEEDVEAVKGGLAGLSGGDSDLDAALAASLAAEDQLQAEEVDGVLAVQLAAEMEESSAQAAAMAAAAKERHEASVLGRVTKGLATLPSLFSPRAAPAASAAAAPASMTHLAEPSLWDLPPAGSGAGAGAGAGAPHDVACAPLVRRSYSPLLDRPAAASASAAWGGDSDLDAALAASLAAEDQLHGAVLAAPPRAPPPLPGAPPVSVPMLLGMGFSWGQVHHALEATGDLHLAQEMLLQQRAALMIPGPD